MTGRMYSERWGRIAAIFVFIGFNMTFFTQFMLGSQGMPRRYADYTVVPVVTEQEREGLASAVAALEPVQNHFQLYHQISSIGAFILGFGFLIMLIYLFHSLFRGPKAPDNPWGSCTMEWWTKSPPIHHNFHGQPVALDEPYDYGVDPKEATVKA